MSQTAPKIRTKTVSEERIISINCSGKLDSGELIASVGTATEFTTSDLVLSNESVSTAILKIDKIDVPIGEAIQLKVTGGVAGVTYIIQVPFASDSTPAQQLRGRVTLYVEAD